MTLCVCGHARHEGPCLACNREWIDAMDAGAVEVPVRCTMYRPASLAKQGAAVKDQTAGYVESIQRQGRERRAEKGSDEQGETVEGEAVNSQNPLHVHSPDFTCPECVAPYVRPNSDPARLAAVRAEFEQRTNPAVALADPRVVKLQAEDVEPTVSMRHYNALLAVVRRYQTMTTLEHIWMILGYNFCENCDQLRGRNGELCRVCRVRIFSELAAAIQRETEK